jgi:hypothetical protein
MAREESNRIVRQVVKRALMDRTTDFVYWQSRPFEERLAALEEIRREFHVWRFGAEPRFQRVLEVVGR